VFLTFPVGFPGIARKVFGKVDPKNPKTLIVETHTIDCKRQITVYIPAQYKAGSEAPFMIVHDGPQGKPSMALPQIRQSPGPLERTG